MVLERAQESLRAAELCLEAELVNSAASRAYYAMFQAREADYGSEGVSRTMARRIVRQASVFVATVQEGTKRGSRD